MEIYSKNAKLIHGKLNSIMILRGETGKLLASHK